jgi:hypothetical protein
VLHQILRRAGVGISPGAAMALSPVDAGDPGWRMSRSIRVRE